MMITTATQNGGAPGELEPAASRYEVYIAEAEQRRDRLTGELRELLDAEGRVRDELEQALGASREREKRLQRSIDALDPPTAPAPVAPKKKASQSTWTVSAKNVEKVLATLTAFDGSASVAEVAQRAGLAHETTRRALEQLRAAERTRVAGHRKGRGGGAKVWALMPNGEGDRAEN